MSCRDGTASVPGLRMAIVVGLRSNPLSCWGRVLSETDLGLAKEDLLPLGIRWEFLLTSSSSSCPLLSFGLCCLAWAFFCLFVCRECLNLVINLLSQERVHRGA